MEMARTKVQIYLMFLRSISNTSNSLLHFQVKKNNAQQSISLAVGLSRGFRDKRLYLALYLSVFWELRDKKNLKNI